MPGHDAEIADELICFLADDAARAKSSTMRSSNFDTERAEV